MRIIVYGAGAVGGVIGARLFQAGADVVLIARGAHHDAIAAGGLRLETADGVAALPIPVVDHPSAVAFRDGDVVLLAMKSQGTIDALEALEASAPPDVPVACVQNGVSNERAALRLRSNVQGVCVMCPCGHLSPGVVQALSAPITGLLDVGRYPSGADDVTRSLAAAFEGATFESRVLDDVMRWKHRKLLMNLSNAVEAVCGNRGSELSGLARAEGEAALRAAGIPYVSEAEDKERRGDRLRIRPIEGTGERHGSSTWQSLARDAGTIETDHLNGEIVLLGRLHGVPTPVNEALRRLADDLARRHRPPGSVSEADVLALAASLGAPARPDPRRRWGRRRA